MFRIAMIGVVAAGLGCGSGSAEEPREDTIAAAERLAEWYWLEMLEFQERNPPADDEAPFDWLHEAIDHNSIQFWRMASEPLSEVKVRWFVSQFGKHGDEADLAWILCSPYDVLCGIHAAPKTIVGE